MDKPIEIIFMKQAEDFVDKLEEKSRRKLFKSIRKTKAREIGHWFKKLKGTDGIYEFRFDESGKFYRLFAFWDNEYKTETLVIGTHGIAKKTNKTPSEEIKKAERIKREYFEEKREAEKVTRTTKKD
ncbi:MAG: type II toxin-antitoxin system RelE/ParE family toxin [Tenuifilaceae bacterium]|nr:type II toxin-antitoxin system RelE/ParE family toxin [Tenuifilaceae bacterium]